MHNNTRHSPDNIGKRIKELRLSKGLTQKELAGEMISRNMLSMIESGIAYPSIETLLYFSNVLDVNPGYFFADENEVLFYKKQELLDKTHSLMESKKYDSVSELLTPYPGNDNEIAQYLALSNYNIAIRYFGELKLTTALRYLESAADIAEKINYNGTDLRKTYTYCSVLVESLAKMVIPYSLIDPKQLIGVPVSPSFTAYLSVLRLIPENELKLADAIVRSGVLNDVHSLSIRAELAMKEKQFEDASHLIETALSADDTGFYSRYRLISDLEVCKRKCGDYEMAYSLSSARHVMHGIFAE